MDADVLPEVTEQYGSEQVLRFMGRTRGPHLHDEIQTVRREGRRHRALNPFADADAQLLAIVNRGEFALNGFRNRDVRTHLYAATNDTKLVRRQTAAVGRRRLCLRALSCLPPGSHWC